MRRFAPAILAAILGGGGAMAQTLADFERIDANRDSALSLAEFEDANRRDFDLLDVDKSGRLSRAEFVLRRGGDPGVTSLRERRFAELDANRDGGVSRDEYLVFARRQFARLDRDNDGRIGRAEFEAALAGRGAPSSADPRPLERPPTDRPPPRAGRDAPAALDETALRQAFARIDRNGDGFVTPEELDAARLEAFRAMDADGDGRLSRTEVVAARGPDAGSRLAELDRDRDGFISRREFVDAGRQLLRAADANRDGRLIFEEFARAPER